MIRHIIVAIVVMAFVTAVAPPQAQAELVTITVVLAAAFTSAVVTAEVVKSEDEEQIATRPSSSDLAQRASLDAAVLGPASR